MDYVAIAFQKVLLKLCVNLHTEKKSEYLRQLLSVVQLNAIIKQNGAITINLKVLTKTTKNVMYTLILFQIFFCFL